MQKLYVTKARFLFFLYCVSIKKLPLLCLDHICPLCKAPQFSGLVLPLQHRLFCAHLHHLQCWDLCSLTLLVLQHLLILTWKPPLAPLLRWDGDTASFLFLGKNVIRESSFVKRNIFYPCACLYICLYSTFISDACRWEHQILWKWSYRQLWVKG